jgi:hypothetical protein
LLNRLQTDQSLARYTGWFIPLKIETNGEEWGKWASRYRHEGDSIPIVFVVRADGQQLYAKSGSLPGPELLVMIEQVLSQAGTVYSDQQLQILQSTLDKSQELLTADDTAGAVREFSKISKLGTLGQLGSYARAAVEADGFAQKLVEQGKTALTGANNKLGQEATRLEGALALAETKRIYSALPPLKGDLAAAASAARTNPELRGTLKLAEQLDEARDLLQKPTGQRRAVTALNRIIAENPGTLAAKMAGDWLQEQNLAATPAVAAPTAADKTFRLWTSDRGTTIDAALVNYGYGDPATKKDPYVVLEKRDGQQITVPLARLSADSQQLVTEDVKKIRSAKE